MKRLLMITVALLLAIPLTVFSMNHKTMDHSNMKMGSDKASQKMMEMMSDSIMLGEEEVDGVKTMVHLADVKEKMAAAGMPHTHHLMMMFTYMETGATIEEGLVAVKVTDPDDNESEAMKMMGMQGHFGVDLTLDKPGMWHFKIGTKLPDGKKRVFHQSRRIE